MNQRTRLTLYVLAGLYLLYTGAKLVAGVIKDQPDNMFLYLIVGLAFLAGGAGLAFFSAKEYYMGDYFHRTGANDTYEDDAEPEENAPLLESKDDSDPEKTEDTDKNKE